MEIKLTAVFRKFPEGYAAFVEELPGANTQGKTLEEVRSAFFSLPRGRSEGDRTSQHHIILHSVGKVTAAKLDEVLKRAREFFIE
jgi:hypothetical protein